MRLEDQVVPLQISNKLKELGIDVIPTFYHVYEFMTGWQVVLNGQFSQSCEEIDFLPAYTVAELGYMLPTDIRAKRHYSYYHRYNWKGHSVGYSEVGGSDHIEIGWHEQEASARAILLITLIDNGHITSAEINVNFTTKSL